MSEPVLLATRSAGKLRELRPMFAAAGLRVVDLAEAGVAPGGEEDELERFDTFERNALAKAHYFLARTGLVTFADDSGLEVAALGAAPGVRSKRWSGRTDLSGEALDGANNQRLLEQIADREDRAARYVCAAAYCDWTAALVVQGETRGRLVSDPRGALGFGYDPYFLSDELGVTFGEATREQKEVVSHRGRAFRALLSAVARR